MTVVFDSYAFKSTEVNSRDTVREKAKQFVLLNFRGWNAKPDYTHSDLANVMFFTFFYFLLLSHKLYPLCAIVFILLVVTVVDFPELI